MGHVHVADHASCLRDHLEPVLDPELDRDRRGRRWSGTGLHRLLRRLHGPGAGEAEGSALFLPLAATAAGVYYGAGVLKTQTMAEAENFAGQIKTGDIDQVLNTLQSGVSFPGREDIISVLNTVKDKAAQQGVDPQGADSQGGDQQSGDQQDGTQDGSQDGTGQEGGDGQQGDGEQAGGEG